MRVFTAKRAAVLGNFFLDQETPKFEVLPAYLSPPCPLAHSLTSESGPRVTSEDPAIECNYRMLAVEICSYAIQESTARYMAGRSLPS